MSIRQLFAELLRADPKPGPGGAYREPAPVSGAEVVRELGQSIAALQLRVRMLEVQLRAEGARPIHTPSATDVRQIVEVMHGLARGESPRKNTLELQLLADSLLGLLELED